jgi:SAM-dependent methyltransferase
MSKNNIETFAYAGVDNLDIMASACRYNAFIVDEITRHCSRAKTLLDFGAGIGTFAKALRDKGYCVDCFEPDTAFAEKLKKENFRTFSKNEELPKGQYDLIICLNVLEHIENDSEIVEMLKMSLKAGGEIFIFVPAFKVLYSSMDRKVGHYRRYSKSSLMQLITTAGLAVGKIYYVDSLGFFATLLFKLIGSKSGEITHTSIRFYDKFIFGISRIVDRFTGRWFGKNLIMVAKKI